MKKYIVYRLLAMIALSIICLTCVECASKQKATDRYENRTAFETEQSSSEKIQKDIKKDCTAVTTQETDWKSINENIQFELIDPTQEGYANVSPDGKGGFNFTGKNTKVTSGKSQEQKSENRRDSITKIEADQSNQELDKSSTSNGQTLDKGRTSNSESSRWPTCIYFVIGLVILVLVGGLILEFRPESLISSFIKKIFRKKSEI
ncbi:MAG: hypothetical protein VYB38_14340 [Bacteroidota bacterium]|nr:hypothetical protein [Bacteroidota bacterium]MEE3243294.1 hypothetical protein [Bacteroidota bacterium]